MAQDKEFQDGVRDAMLAWEDIRLEGLPTLTWWEMIVKPGIRKLAMTRSKEMNKEKREELNFLLIHQAYLLSAQPKSC